MSATLQDADIKRDVFGIYRMNNLGAMAIDIPDSLMPFFKELVQRGTNLWPDAPAEIKHFADRITNGAPMQDYFKNPNLAGKGKPLNADKQ